MKNSTEKSDEQIKFENDNLAQVQGFPDFLTAPKGDMSDVTETLNHIVEKLDEAYPPDMTEEEVNMFHSYFDEQMHRAMEDPEHQEEARRLYQFYHM